MTSRNLTFVAGIEDKEPFLWQTAVLLESLHGQLPEGWGVLIVVCNDLEPISSRLSQILRVYGAAHRTAPNHPIHESIDFAESGAGYGALNKITAMGVAADVVGDEDQICLMDTDIFLYGNLNRNAFPPGDALAQNDWLDEERFYTAKDYVGGVDLKKLLAAAGIERPFLGGAVTLFATGSTLKKPGVVKDCYRFSQIVFLFGKIIEVDNNWVAEMPAYALSLTAHDVPYEIVHRPEFSTAVVFSKEVTEGTFYHYFRGEGTFWGSDWVKQTYLDRDLLIADLPRYHGLAQTDHERWFFEMAQRAARRVASADTGGEPSDPVTPTAKAGEPALSPTTRLRRAVGDRLRYLSFHAQQAKDPKAPDYRELDLPLGTRLLYRVLSRGRRDDGK